LLLLAGCTSAPEVPPLATDSSTPTVAISMPEDEPGATLTPSPELVSDPANSPAASPTTQDLPAEPIRFVIVPELSEARYRVREQLANLALPNDAVGATRAITGELVIHPDGSIDSAQSRFEVDVSTLLSDQSRRDNFLRNNILKTGQYPRVIFVPTHASGLPEILPESGEVNFRLSGDMTILDLTRPVDWEVKGAIQGGIFSGQAVTGFTFDEFGLDQPRVPIVLSVDDLIRLEMDFTLQREGD
jgi:polyisoprenoid-binding protein YceI